YCAPNELLRVFISKISNRYQYVVMDNEAGMEHLSRRTTNDVDVLFIIAEPSLISIRSAIKVSQTAKQIKLKVKKIFLVLNRTRMDTDLKKLDTDLHGFGFIGMIPEDNLIKERGEKAGDLLSLPEDSLAVKAVGEIMRKAEII
ncbi:unnamed protein product, partial [marine sediment metagenome]